MRAPLVVLLVIGSQLPAAADSPMPAATFEADHTVALAANPPGVTLSARTEGNRTRFADGEKIALILKFSSTVLGKYHVGVADYDRSGRLWTESFHFDPPTVVDPLADYFAGMGSMGGIAPTSPALAGQPVEVAITLNDWARFKPGKYRFYVTSSRVETGAASTTYSNLLDVEFVDDLAWAEKERARLVSVITAGPADDEPENPANRARAALRYLNTKAAARSMVDDLCRPGGGYRFATHFGLFSSPFRADVIAMLERGLAAPDCAVSSGYVQTLSHLEVVASHKGAQFDVAYRAVIDPITHTLVAALGHKTGAPRAVSLHTALELIAARAQRDGKPDPDAARLRDSLASVLGALPDDALEHLLEDQWQIVRSPAIAPALLALVKEARPRGSQLRSISDLALERLFDLDYAAAQAVVMAELARAGGARVSFTGATLSLLKDRELPALDAKLLAGLAAPESDGATLELRAEVVARYASKAILSDVWRLYRDSSYFRVSLLAYLLRNDPKAAEAAVRQLGDFDSLNRLAKLEWNPMIEQLVIARLRTGDASQAAELLAERGSPAAEAALIARWRELHVARSDKDKLAPQLRQALIQGRAWITTPDKLATLAALCDDPECKRDLAGVADRWGAAGKEPELVVWSIAESGAVTGWIAHYDVRSVADVELRIRQMPAGVTLLWGTKPKDVDDALVAKMRAWASERNVAIVSR